MLDRVANRFHAKANSAARERESDRERGGEGSWTMPSSDEALIRFLCRVKYAARFTPDFTYRKDDDAIAPAGLQLCCLLFIKIGVGERGGRERGREGRRREGA